MHLQKNALQIPREMGTVAIRQRVQSRHRGQAGEKLMRLRIAFAGAQEPGIDHVATVTVVHTVIRTHTEQSACLRFGKAQRKCYSKYIFTPSRF